MKIIIFIFLILVLVFALSIFFGYFFQDASAKQLLKKTLKNSDINIDSFPDDFFTETIKACRTISDAVYRLHGRESKTTYFVATLEGEANNIAYLLHKNRDNDDPLSYQDETLKRLKKHRIL